MPTLARVPPEAADGCGMIAGSVSEPTTAQRPPTPSVVKSAKAGMRQISPSRARARKERKRFMVAPSEERWIRNQTLWPLEVLILLGLGDAH